MEVKGREAEMVQMRSDNALRNEGGTQREKGKTVDGEVPGYFQAFLPYHKTRNMHFTPHIAAPRLQRTQKERGHEGSIEGNGFREEGQGV